MPHYRLEGREAMCVIDFAKVHRAPCCSWLPIISNIACPSLPLSMQKVRTLARPASRPSTSQLTTRRHRALLASRTIHTVQASTLYRCRVLNPRLRRTMATDDEYMNFLEKANEDPMKGHAKTESKPGRKGFKTLDEGEEVPAAIQGAIQDKFFVSEADEPFGAVVLRWDEAGKELPDEGMRLLFSFSSVRMIPRLTLEPGAVEFAGLIQHPDPENAEVGILDPADWDAQGEYGDVVDAVVRAVKGADVRVYRVPRDAARTDYFVLGCEGSGKTARLVGVRALSIES
jgi:hypothetical protein